MEPGIKSIVHSRETKTCRLHCSKICTNCQKCNFNFVHSLKGLNSLTRKGGFKLEGTVFKFCQTGFIFAEFQKTEFRDWNGVEKKAGTGY